MRQGNIVVVVVAALFASLPSDRTCGQSYLRESSPLFAATADASRPDVPQAVPSSTTMNPDRDWFASETTVPDVPLLNTQTLQRSGPPARRGGFVGGAEVLTASTYFEDSVALTHLNNGGNSRDVRTFTNHFDASPRFWLGYANEEGLGGRVRYWNYNQNFGPVGAVDTGASTQIEAVIFSGSNITESIFKLLSLDGDTMNVTAGIDVQVLDLEGTVHGRVGAIKFDACAGLRYAVLQQHYQGVLTDGGGATAETLTQNLHYEGLGLTGGAVGYRPFPIAPDVSAFAGARISVLYGRMHETKGFVSTRSANKDFDRRADEVLTILEIPAGLEWSRTFASGARGFVRTTVEAQVWANGGNLQSDVNSFSLLGLGAAFGLDR